MSRGWTGTLDDVQDRFAVVAPIADGDPDRCGCAEQRGRKGVTVNRASQLCRYAVTLSGLPDSHQRL